MVVPAAKVKEICTDQEARLVRSSRKPAIDLLGPAELKRHAARARKLYDKWLAQSRSQSRARSKKLDFGESPANTALKAQAMGDALASFEGRLAKLDGASTATKRIAPRNTKPVRSAAHRATRAEVRQELNDASEELRVASRKADRQRVKKKAKKVAAKKTSATTARIKTGAKRAESVTGSGGATAAAAARTKGAKSARKTAKKAARKATAPAKKAAKKKTLRRAKRTAAKSSKKGAEATQPSMNTTSAMDLGQSRQATTAAKQSRLDRSGKSSRVRGHVSARGKRAQGRRDSRN